MNDLAPMQTKRSRSSIGNRLALAALAVGIVVSVVVTAGQLWFLYRNERTVAQQSLEDIGRAMVPSVANSLWNVDMERAGILLDGIVNEPGISYVRLRSRDGDLIERGQAGKHILARHTYSLNHDGNGHFELGTLEVQYSDDQIVQRIERRTLAIVTTTFSTLVITMVLLLLFFRFWVTKHLDAMAKYAAELNFERLQIPLRLEGKRTREPPDELDQVVLSINRMREALSEEMEAQKITEHELELHRNHLAEIVRARTAALNEKTRELEEQKAAISLLANTDALTGVYTRRHFYELAKLEISRSWRTGESLSLLLLDIDHFKQVNDTHGHAVGDAALIALAGVFKATLRDFDVVGRMGGEEFAVLLVGDDLQHAQMAAERLRLAVAGSPVTVGDGAINLTISIGATSLETPDQDLDVLLKIADGALYAAKRGGRNRVEVASSAD